MEYSEQNPGERGLELSEEARASLYEKTSALVDDFLNFEELEGMDPQDKEHARTFVKTSLSVLTDNKLVVNEKTTSEIAIATAPDLERRRIEESYTDKDTGLANKEAFQAAQERIDTNPDIDFLFLDIINLGEINNKVTYADGTKIICSAAECIRTEAEKLGIERRDVFRVGSGDEFGVAVPKDLSHYLLWQIQQGFGVQDLVGSRGSVQTALRGVYADTFEQADVLMQDLKAAGKKNALQRTIGRIARREPLMTHLKGQ